MRSQNQLLSSRTRVRPRYALFPLEGIPFSRLPEWPGAQVRVLAGPALGAQFVEYLIELQPGQGGAHRADGGIEYFFYVLSGDLTLAVDGRSNRCRQGGFALVPPTSGFTAEAAAPDPAPPAAQALRAGAGHRDVRAAGRKPGEGPGRGLWRRSRRPAAGADPGRAAPTTWR